MPEDPDTPYYRTFATRVDDEAHLYEFVVPTVAPERNDPNAVLAYGDLLGRTSTPTAGFSPTETVIDRPSGPQLVPLLGHGGGWTRS